MKNYFKPQLIVLAIKHNLSVFRSRDGRVHVDCPEGKCFEDGLHMLTCDGFGDAVQRVSDYGTQECGDPQCEYCHDDTPKKTPQQYAEWMNWTLIYPVQLNSDRFIYNDGGREDAGRTGDTGDCVCRAVAIAAQLPYEQVYQRLAEGNATQRKTKRSSKNTGKRTASKGINVRRKWFDDYMKELGFTWVPTMKIGQGCKVHLKREELPAGRLIVNVSKHMCAVIDGVIHDTYDPSREGTRCVYGYYIKKEEKVKLYEITARENDETGVHEIHLVTEEEKNGEYYVQFSQEKIEEITNKFIKGGGTT